MNLSPEIFDELKAISPLLAGLERINVFQVPEGYFNGLNFRIADYAILNNTSAVDNINKRTLQQVPAGYFDTLSDSILAKVKAADSDNPVAELQSISPLLSDLKSTVLSVPEGYFESLSSNIIEKLHLQAANSESAEEELQRLSPMLLALKGNVFSVPTGYFESLSGNIVEKLHIEAVNSESPEEELQRLSPILFGLKENVLSVPEGYFESFAGDVIKKLKPEPAKVVIMKKNSWLRYAAAAVVTGIIAASSFLIYNSTHRMDNDKAFSALPSYVKASFQYKTENDLNAGIAKLSDEDIIKYLEKSGNIMDNELLINNTDVSEMPSQADYLDDENTLNTYLDKIDSEASDKLKP